jgi:hypothetical protein
LRVLEEKKDWTADRDEKDPLGLIAARQPWRLQIDQSQASSGLMSALARCSERWW